MKRELEAGTSVEMAILFPLSFLILMVLMQLALNLTVRLYTDVVMRQAMMVCITSIREGCGAEEAVENGEGYLEKVLGEVSGLIVETQWEEKEGFLEESFSLSLEGSYHFLTAFSWQQEIEESYMDPILFKNRVDLVVEVIKGMEE